MSHPPVQFMKAHQRVIRERIAEADPRPQLVSLDGFRVRQITRDQAESVILKYEWLGTMNRPLACYGLFSPDSDAVLGVACFGKSGGSKAASSILGPDFANSAICLERGACVHWAPDRAPSFL